MTRNFAVSLSRPTAGLFGGIFVVLLVNIKQIFLNKGVFKRKAEGQVGRTESLEQARELYRCRVGCLAWFTVDFWLSWRGCIASLDITSSESELARSYKHFNHSIYLYFFFIKISKRASPDNGVFSRGFQQYSLRLAAYHYKSSLRSEAESIPYLGMHGQKSASGKDASGLRSSRT